MDNNDLMDGQYDPDFDTLSMLSDDSGYYSELFFNFFPLICCFFETPKIFDRLNENEKYLTVCFRCWLESDVKPREV